MAMALASPWVFWCFDSSLAIRHSRCVPFSLARSGSQQLLTEIIFIIIMHAFAYAWHVCEFGGLGQVVVASLPSLPCFPLSLVFVCYYLAIALSFYFL